MRRRLHVQTITIGDSSTGSTGRLLGGAGYGYHPYNILPCGYLLWYEAPAVSYGIVRQLEKEHPDVERDNRDIYDRQPTRARSAFVA